MTKDFSRIRIEVRCASFAIHIEEVYNTITEKFTNLQ